MCFLEENNVFRAFASPGQDCGPKDVPLGYSLMSHVFKMVSLHLSLPIGNKPS